MESFLFVLGVLLLLLGCLVGLLSLVIGLPGTFIILGVALLYAWATGFAAVQWSTIGWLVLLALLAEGIEFAASGVGVAGARPSRRVTVGAVAGAIVGGIVGTPFLFGIGSLLGALAGAFAGAALAVTSEGGSVADAASTGFKALRGRLLGFVIKSAIAVLMVVLVLAAAV